MVAAISTVLVVAECTAGQIHTASWDALAFAQELQAAKLVVLVPGDGADALTAEFNTCVHEVLIADDSLLGSYKPELFKAAVQQAIEQLNPDYIVAAHTYQGCDYMPRLAASNKRSVIANCQSVNADADEFIFTRSLFSGRLNGTVTPAGAAPHFITVEPGSYGGERTSIDGLAETAQGQFSLSLGDVVSRGESQPPKAAERQDTNLAEADAIVAVGRGLGSAENLNMARRLAELLGAELAASRPICDEGWLPMNHQVGNSGITVAPKLYIAIGISGAIQHLAGMRGSGTIIAINKDPNAPIFGVADIGVVGDLHKIVPALIEALEG